MTHWEKCWEFNTARFRVVFEVTECPDAPEDSFQFQDDIDAVRNGAVEWFDCRVRVLLDGQDEIGSDYLGGCAYYSVREFYTSHRDPDPMNRNCTIMRRAWQGGNDPNAKISICHYFPGMVAQAVAEARSFLAEAPKLRAAS